jgi:hypothetical protein
MVNGGDTLKVAGLMMRAVISYQTTDWLVTMATCPSPWMKCEVKNVDVGYAEKLTLDIILVVIGS